jgi:predicted MFS family arabinose efflux permease
MTQRLATTALGGLAALAVAMGIGRFAFTPILPMMQDDAGLSVAQGGWLASANYLGYLVGALTAGALRASPAGVIRAGLVAVGLSTLAMGLFDHMIAWLALRALAGVASAWVLVFAMSWCLEQFDAKAPPQRRAMLSATVFAGVGVGIMAAGLACVAFLVAGVSSRIAWIALGIVSLAVAALLWRRVGDERGAEPAPAAPRLVWNATSLRMIACYLAFGFGYIIPATFLAAMARATFPDPAVYGWSWPVFGAAAALSTFAAAAVRRWISDRALWIASTLLMAAGVWLPLGLDGLGGIIASALLVGGTFMVMTMAAMQETRRVAGADARALIAAMTSSFAVGQIAGPLLVGMLAARGIGFAPALAAAGVALVASAAVLLFHPAQRAEAITRP